MSRVPAVRIVVQRQPFDAAAEVARLPDGATDVGALVSLVGVCRDEGGRLAALELEHYPGMAEAEIGRIAGEAVRRWSLRAVTVIHRFGRILPGEAIVLVATAAVHRHEALRAAGFLIDFLKTEAPFWKKEHLCDGTVGDWVAPKAADAAAAARWTDRDGTAGDQPTISTPENQ